MRVRSALTAALVFAAAHVFSVPAAEAVSPDIVVSQVYGGGGNAGAMFANDFVELFNRGRAAVSVSGWSVQYASANGTSWAVTPLTGTIPAGGYFLVKEAGNGGGGSALPAPDVSGSTAMSAAAGKVALGPTTTPFSGAAPTGAQLRDLVGYGAANGFEGAAPAPSLSATTAGLRVDGGCADGDNNASDFVSGDPLPRNSSSSGRACHDVVISQIYGGGGNAGAPYQNDYVELFNRSTTSVDVSGWSVQYASATGSVWSLTRLSGSIPAGRHFLVQEAGGDGSGAALPTPDSVGSINAGSTDGKVALVSNSSVLSGNGPFGTGVRDFVGYGGANAFEGSAPAPSPSNTTVNQRAGEGCLDTDENAGDFMVAPPAPRNAAASPRSCAGSTARHTVSDFDGNGATDIAVYRPSGGLWYVKDQPATAWGGSAGDVPVPGDYKGDGKTDVAIYRPSQGLWYVKDRSVTAWGTSGDVPVPGDYNGDGTTDIAMYRPSTGAWYVKDQPVTAWGGSAGDVPVPGDYNGDGKTDIAIYRRSQGVWYVKGQSNLAWGAAGDIPVPGDYNGDGRTDLAVHRPSQGGWYVKDQSVTAWGTSGDVPVPGDYNGDAKTDIAVYRPAQGIWYVKDQFATAWGVGGDAPLPLPPAVRQAFFT